MITTVVRAMSRGKIQFAEERFLKGPQGVEEVRVREDGTVVEDRGANEATRRG